VARLLGRTGHSRRSRAEAGEPQQESRSRRAAAETTHRVTTNNKRRAHDWPATTGGTPPLDDPRSQRQRDPTVASRLRTQPVETASKRRPTPLAAVPDIAEVAGARSAPHQDSPPGVGSTPGVALSGKPVSSRRRARSATTVTPTSGPGGQRSAHRPRNPAGRPPRAEPRRPRGLGRSGTGAGQELGPVRNWGRSGTQAGAPTRPLDPPVSTIHTHFSYHFSYHCASMKPLCCTLRGVDRHLAADLPTSPASRTETATSVRTSRERVALRRELRVPHPAARLGPLAPVPLRICRVLAGGP